MAVMCFLSMFCKSDNICDDLQLTSASWQQRIQFPQPQLRKNGIDVIFTGTQAIVFFHVCPVKQQ